MTGRIDTPGSWQATAGIVMPVLANCLEVAAVTASVANRYSGSRVVIPRTGNLRDLTIFVGTQSGNIIGTVYDTGDASPGNRTKLWDSGSVAVGVGNAWQTIGDPNLPVVAGQHVDIGFIVDNATATFGRVTTVTTTAPGQLPSSFLVAPGGAPPKLLPQAALGSFAAPATFAESGLSIIGSSIFMVIARIS